MPITSPIPFVPMNRITSRHTAGSRSALPRNPEVRRAGCAVPVTSRGSVTSADAPTTAEIARPTRQLTPASASTLPIASATATPIVTAAPNSPTSRAPPLARATTGTITNTRPAPRPTTARPTSTPANHGLTVQIRFPTPASRQARMIDTLGPRRCAIGAAPSVTIVIAAKNTVMVRPTVDSEIPNSRLIAVVAGPMLPPPYPAPAATSTTIAVTLGDGEAQTADISDMILRDGRRCARC